MLALASVDVRRNALSVRTLGEPGTGGVGGAADQWGAERDDLRDQVGAPAGHLAHHDAAETPAHEGDGAFRLGRETTWPSRRRTSPRRRRGSAEAPAAGVVPEAAQVTAKRSGQRLRGSPSRHVDDGEPVDGCPRGGAQTTACGSEAVELVPAVSSARARRRSGGPAGSACSSSSSGRERSPPADRSGWTGGHGATYPGVRVTASGAGIDVPEKEGESSGRTFGMGTGCYPTLSFDARHLRTEDTNAQPPQAHGLRRPGHREGGRRSSRGALSTLAGRDDAPAVPGVPGSEPPTVEQPTEPQEPLPPKPDQAGHPQTRPAPSRTRRRRTWASRGPT